MAGPLPPSRRSSHVLPACLQGLLRTMRPALTAQLFLSFSVIQALQESYELPAPRLEVEPSYPVPLGATLLLRCRGASDPFSYRFYKEALREALSLEDSCWESMTPHLRHPQARLGGRYRCQYDFHAFWSKLSVPRDVPVADLYEEPFLWETPGLSVPPGENVTFHCNSSGGLDKFVLYHSTPERGFRTLKPQDGNEAVVPLHNETEEINGNYTCKGYVSSEPHRWSAATDSLVLSGGGLPPGCRKAVLLHVVLALAMLRGLGAVLKPGGPRAVPVETDRWSSLLPDSQAQPH
ncbi:platelet glycoprotein VI-like [Antechinus flavipes]|uniref:platelet glycoprotein VI-like n=1 Tax=Antechinus flavipes TaxID=38775 RepID=UPI002235F28D|nr:platelet glycoprotein VI-like [Antechinus flavipes]